MTNAEAIETLRVNYPDACYEQLREAVDAAIEALKAQDAAGDTISRQAAIEALEEQLDYLHMLNKDENPTAESEWYGVNWARNTIADLPSAEPYTEAEIQKMQELEQTQLQTAYELGKQDAQTEQQWIPCSERLPEDLEEVNVTWVNHAPEQYYEFMKDKPFTGSAVYYKGSWYWDSSTCVDILAEYGRNEIDKIDDGIEVVAWMPLPEPYKGDMRGAGQP